MLLLVLFLMSIMIFMNIISLQKEINIIVMPIVDCLDPIQNNITIVIFLILERIICL